jgi:hypothetical protein
MKAIHWLLIGLLAPALGGCMTPAQRRARDDAYDAQLTSWRGGSERALLDGWGYPSSRYDYANGGRTLSYRYRDPSSCYYSQVTAQTLCGECTVDFEVDPAGTVVNSRFKGLVHLCERRYGQVMQ